LLEAGIIGFAVVDAVFKDRPAGSLPGCVRMNFGHVAAGIFNIKLKHQAARFIPALAEHHANGVFALPEKAGYVVSRIENSFLVVSPARIKHMIAGSAAIEVELIVAQTGDISSGTARLFRQSEFVAKETIASNPLSLPV